MSDLSFKDLSEELDFGFFLDTEGIDYKEVFGSSGEQFNIRECPACGNNKWKVYMGIESGLGNCFRCEEPFTRLSFLKFYFDLNTWGDVRFKCEEVLREQGWRPKRKKVERPVIDTSAVKLPISVALPMEGGQTLQYLADRGITNEITEMFGLRYSQHGMWIFTNQEGQKQVQHFSNRLIIPVCDLDGTLKTYQGRDLTGLSEKKYLFPMTLPGTGRYLLNGHNSMGTPHVVMGEGAFDVMAIRMALDTDLTCQHVGAVGSFGKHLSHGSKECDDQLGRFRSLQTHGLKIVTIMWDGETSALMAALEAAKVLSKLGLKVRIAFLPRGKDPNEVPAAVVLHSFKNAVEWTPMLTVKLQMKNPYK